MNADYTSALEAYRQWFDLWLVTGLPRHRDTAATCLQIARERCTASSATVEIQAARVRWIARSQRNVLEARDG